MDVFRILMFGLHAIVSILLIGLVVMQTHRSEGLGAMGGSSAPAMRGRAGVEEKLAEYTKYVAAAFMILSALLYLFSLKFNWH
jgi:protein translocase SecG subunit